MTIRSATDAARTATRLKASLPVRLRNAALRGYYSIGNPDRAVPDYFIIGVKRGGTTSLDAYIKAHPDVLSPPVNKGSRYFDAEHHRGQAWFRRNLLPRRVLDRHARQTGRRAIVGESSPYASYHPDAMARIHEVNPEAKLLLLLREPVDRAHSHFKYESARHFETEDFSQALRLEAERLAGGAGVPDVEYARRHFSYVARGRYGEQIARILEHFPREQLLAVKAERFYADTAEVMNEVFAFLDLAPMEHSEFTPLKPLKGGSVSPEDREFITQALAEDQARLHELLPELGRWPV